MPRLAFAALIALALSGCASPLAPLAVDIAMDLAVCALDPAVCE